MKRIKELLNVCGLPNESSMELAKGGSTTITQYYLENFAKDIIAECLAANHAAIDDLKDEGMGGTPGFNTILNLVEVSCRNKICDTFGVTPKSLTSLLTN